MEREYVKTSFGNISFLRRKGKYPLLMLHGLGGTGNSFLKLLPLIKPDIDMIMIDLLGHGRSDKPVIDYTIENQVKAITEFTDILGIDNFSIMGNSYGGWISLRMTVDSRKPMYLILEDSAGINITYGEMDEDTRSKFINGLIKNNPLNQRHVLESIVKNNANPRWKLKEPELSLITSKTIIIWGDNDRIIPIKYGEELKSKIPNSVMFVIPEGGHVPHLNKPVEVSKVINENLVFQ